jgi:serine/threonine protein kinase/tetratricopeptide (TPR) repeat protein
MICARCGKLVSASADSCPSCGAGIAVGVLTPRPTSTTLVDNEAKQRASEFLTVAASGQPSPPRSAKEEQTIAQTVSATSTSVTIASSRGAPPVHSGPLPIGEGFGNRYHVIRMVGAGGMGAVYQAWDAELGVTVAIKVIRPEITANPNAAADVERRLKRELVLARQVTHRNVVRIHDLGEINGVKYITMPYIEGADLATVLRKEGRLSVAKTLPIIRSVVSGLVAAHTAGVVHRDLKPANIMIDDSGEALIMDFGIARSTGAPAGTRVPGSTTIISSLKLAQAQPDATVLGTVVGTVEYMAPEQARGVAVDLRADVYALGLIMYDMLAGRSRLTTAKNAIDELRQRMEQMPPTVKAIVPEIPRPLDRLISRCLEPDPAKRFQSTAELESALNQLDDNGEQIRIKRVFSTRLVAPMVVTIVGLLGITWFLARRPVAPVAHEQLSVLISDFQNATGDRAFAGSLEQALTIALESAPFITTFDRDEARKVLVQLKAGEALDETAARVISTREGIKVVLAGSIAAKSSGYTLSLKAVDPANGNVLGSATASASDKGDVLKALGTVASRTRLLLGDVSPESEKTAAAETVTTASLEALADYSRGQQRLFDLQAEEAIVYYKRAIERDPNFGRAYANWATAAGNLGRRDEAAELWKKALALTDRMTEREKYRTFGGYYLAMTQNYDKAIESFSTLVKLFPYDSVGHVNLALAYFYNRQFDKALEEGRRSIEVDPKSLINHNNYALYAMYSGDFNTAETEAQNNIKQDPRYFRSYLPAAVAAIVKTDYPAALDAYTKMSQGDAQAASVASIGVADLAIFQGRFADAVALVRDRVNKDRKGADTSYAAAKLLILAEAYEAEGQAALALDAAHSALEVGPRHESVLVPAGRLLARLGRESEASALSAELGQQLEPHSRAYAATLEAMIAARRHRTIDAVNALRGALKLTDLWLGRLDLGTAYVEGGYPAEGLTELELCLKRRGEGSAVFLDDVPTLRYQATLPYWLARAQEGVGLRDAAAQNYKEYVRIRSAAVRDSLVADARRRLQKLAPS